MRDYSRNFSLRGKIKPKVIRKNTRLKPVLVFLLLILSGMIYFGFQFRSKLAVKTDLPTSPLPKINPDVTSGQKSASSAELMNNIEKEVSQYNSSTYSVYIYDINNKKEYGLREKTVFPAASVNKIPILAAIYQLAKKNEVDLDKQITLQPSDVQDYGSGTIRYDPPGTTYSVKTLARLMMEKSDNTAAFILANMIMKQGKIQNLVDDWHLTQTDINDNLTSNPDMAALLIKMYKGEITSPALTAEMLGFMRKSVYDDRLPAGLPEGTKIYHKTGDDIAKLHDVGIVDLPKRPYYIGIFTSDIPDEETTKKTMANISKMVYEFMNQ